ncbi:MAG TPA: hypothetical protein VMW66_02090 [Elusimicrobiales bacterium]|nr:hypothetical protein [Elusimicrobiales bacterium]
MRLIIFILLFSSVLQGQNYLSYVKGNWKAYSLTGGLILVAGASDGLNQTLDFHYWKFKDRFPKANNQFWNPLQSWTNKYKNWPDDKRAKFWGAKTIFVGVTDGYHFTRFITNTAMIAAGTANFDGAKKWHWYIYDFVILSMFKSAGFNLVYTFFFKT